MYPAARTTNHDQEHQGSQSAAGALIPQRALESRGSPPRGRTPTEWRGARCRVSVEPKTWMLW